MIKDREAGDLGGWCMSLHGPKVTKDYGRSSKRIEPGSRLRMNEECLGSIGAAMALVPLTPYSDMEVTLGA